MSLTYNISNTAFKFVLYLFGNLKISGKDHTPDSGAFIIASNHLSIIDPAIVSLAIPRKVHWLAKDSLFLNPFVGKFLTAYGAHSISRGAPDSSAIQWSVEMLNQDEIIGVFPEGTRHHNGMHKGLNGCALLALQTGVPVVPVGITGTQHLDKLWRLVFPTGKIHVAIGEPFMAGAMNPKPTKDELETTTATIMNKVAAMLPENYRGIYQ